MTPTRDARRLLKSRDHRRSLARERSGRRSAMGRAFAQLLGATALGASVAVSLVLLYGAGEGDAPPDTRFAASFPSGWVGSADIQISSDPMSSDRVSIVVSYRDEPEGIPNGVADLYFNPSLAAYLRECRLAESQISISIDRVEPTALSEGLRWMVRTGVGDDAHISDQLVSHVAFPLQMDKAGATSDLICEFAAAAFWKRNDSNYFFTTPAFAIVGTGTGDTGYDMGSFEVPRSTNIELAGEMFYERGLPSETLSETVGEVRWTGVSHLMTASYTNPPMIAAIQNSETAVLASYGLQATRDVVLLFTGAAVGLVASLLAAGLASLHRHRSSAT